MQKQHNSSWQKVAPWYDKLVGGDGHYYHQHVVLPGVVRLLDLQVDSSLLDLGCGQGVLSRAIKPIKRYFGVDTSKSLIESARAMTRNPSYAFEVADATKSFPKFDHDFSHAALVLSLQNMEHPEGAIGNAAEALQSGGKLVIVLNHPAFRIPRQSGWGVDEKTKQQYRWVNRYASPLKVPITMNPGLKNTQVTWSYHHSLQDYSRMLVQNGFMISALEEWYSDKESEGKAARMENRARSEFPLFMALVGVKQ